MTPDSETQGQRPAVVGESGSSEANPPTPVKGPATDIPGGSDNLSGGGGPASVFDILDEMVGDEDPNTDALRKTLINDGSIVGNSDDDGSTPLHVAATKGLLKAVKVLLDLHARVDAQDNLGRQPLHLACFRGNTDIIQLLLDESADFEARWDGNTPLEAACWSGQVDAVELLIAKGARVSVADNNGFSPLFIASALGYEKIAKVFLGKDKSNINQAERRYGRTPLHAAILMGSRNVASMLIDEGAAVNLQDSAGQTALHMAIAENYSKLVDCLLGKGAKTEIQDNDDWTALHFVARFSDEEIATKVLNKGGRAVIDIKDKHGWTALHIASKQGNEGVVKALLGDEEIRSKLELEINVKDNDDNTALHLASGALDDDVDQDKPDDDSENPREEKSIRQGAIVEALLGAGADLKIKNKKKKTSIDLIMAKGEPYRFRGLLGHISHPFLSLESPSKDLDIEKREANDLLARDGFFALLTNLVDQHPPGTAINTTLRSTLYMILYVLGDDDNRPLLKHFPHALKSLIAASSPNDHLNARLKSVAMSIASILKSKRAQDSKEKVQTSIAMFNRQNKLSLQDKGKQVDKTVYGIPEANLGQNVPEALSKVLNDIADILRDPPFSQLHKDNYSKFITPKAKKGLEGVLEDFEAVIVQFYKEKGVSGSLLRYRSVKEVIYGAGPTTIMAAGSKDKNFKFESGPRFSWIHLPSTNMVWMQDLMMRIMKEEIDMSKAEKSNDRTEQYFALRSFFQDSWIQVPDSETPSRVMKPRALRQSVTSPSQDKRYEGRDMDVVESRVLGPKRETDVRQDGCDKDHDAVEVEPKGDVSVHDASMLRDGFIKNQNADSVHHEAPEPEPNIPQASAVYMPYFCFSTCHNEERDKPKDPERLRAYQALLKAYQHSVIHESPTLDEWYYHFDTDMNSAKDRSTRNQEQVVTKFLKGQEKTKEVPSKNLTAGNTDVIRQASERFEAIGSNNDDHWVVLRVNQIWIWTFADKWIISASSCSLDDSQETLVEGILRQLKKQVEYGGSESQPRTTEAMEKLIVDYCVASYERKPAGEPKMSISQIFSNYMNRIGRGETVLFNRLSRGATGDAESPEDTADLESSVNSVVDRGLAKRFEKKMRESIKLAEDLFADIKDVRDELSILKSAARFQKKVQLDMAENHAKDTNLSADYVENDIKEMDDVADRIQSALNATLSLQQSEIANQQARAANQLAEDAYTQTEYARQQNTVLMTFTIATILFLPLSFLSSLFALDAEAFSKTPNWVFLVIFFVSLGVYVIIIALGFLVYKFAGIENQTPIVLSTGVKGKKGLPIAKAKPGTTAKTTQLIGKRRFGGGLVNRHGRAKLGDQELGNMTISEGN